MTDNELREEIKALVDPGSMATDTIVETLAEDYSRREVQLAAVDMIAKGDLEEHPKFDDVYRLPD
jgi:hypothetical protein